MVRRRYAGSDLPLQFPLHSDSAHVFGRWSMMQPEVNSDLGFSSTVLGAIDIPLRLLSRQHAQ